MLNDSSYSHKSQIVRHCYASIRQFIGYKILFAVFVTLVFVFPDKALLVINDILQLKMNVVGFLLERLLQSIFDIPLRQAQVIAAWVYLVIGVFIIWYVFQKFYQVLFDAFYSMRQSWLAKSRLQKMGISGLIIFLVFALIKLALLFV
ncbi:MAG: hypothetical protein BVN35_14320 [Proteobacteria bacterium ST_bin11]|jgi:hypothetical protein|nr:MAG: hypothetical protein BVN35_14320 [Proteobacteria bacterium ST_bin11]